MRNVFLCFLAAIMFAPNADAALAGSRIVQKNEASTDNVRVATPVRNGGARNSTNTTVRSEKSVSRDVNTRNAARSAETTRSANVVSRSHDDARGGANVKQRTQNANINEILNPTPAPMTVAPRFDNTSRNVANRAATKEVATKKVSAQDVADAKELLEQTAGLNKSCQEQYNECMDQFCAVVDSNQKRCSCSANLSKYAGVQEAVTKANDELNTVAQRIRYVGLSADEIRAIMTETAAEAELDNTRDTSETRSMLSKIETLIQDPTTRTTTVADNDFGLDLDLDFSDSGADIFSLDFLNSETDSISSKRGTALYNAAKKRCKAILNSCTDVGATSNQITGNYDLAIDKDCIAYEQGLQKMNQTLQSNVRSAGLMLQKARLAVLQNKNQYDAKGCISALEDCMTDEMVCGSNYTKCLDPTKRYIDENGKVVLGQDITNITAFMDGFNAAQIDNTKLSASLSVNMDETCKNTPNNDGTCVVKYLLGKIGTGQTVKDGGLCRAVLDKCQQHTYGSNEKYNPYNDIVVNYIQRAMVNIKSAQQQIISEYASSCMTDVAACYNQQVTQVNSWSSVASVSSIKGVMTGACRNVALTCAYAVFANMCTTGEANASHWVLRKGNYWGTYTSTANLPSASSTPAPLLDDYATVNNVLYEYQNASGVNQWVPSTCTPCNSNNTTTCIEGISEIFYQSLLCPESSTYDTQCSSGTSGNRTIMGCVNTQCRCNSGYSVWNGSCLASCKDTEYRNDYGTCTSSCDSGTSLTGSTDTTVTEYSKCE